MTTRRVLFAVLCIMIFVVVTSDIAVAATIKPGPAAETPIERPYLKGGVTTEQQVRAVFKSAVANRDVAFLIPGSDSWDRDAWRDLMWDVDNATTIVSTEIPAGTTLLVLGRAEDGATFASRKTLKKKTSGWRITFSNGAELLVLGPCGNPAAITIGRGDGASPETRPTTRPTVKCPDPCPIIPPYPEQIDPTPKILEGVERIIEEDTAGLDGRLERVEENLDTITAKLSVPWTDKAPASLCFKNWKRRLVCGAIAGAVPVCRGLHCFGWGENNGGRGSSGKSNPNGSPGRM